MAAREIYDILLTDYDKRKGIRYGIFSGFLVGLSEMEGMPVDISGKLFHRLVDYATVYSGGRMILTFRNGRKVGMEI